MTRSLRLALSTSALVLSFAAPAWAGTVFVTETAGGTVTYIYNGDEGGSTIRVATENGKLAFTDTAGVSVVGDATFYCTSSPPNRADCIFGDGGTVVSVDGRAGDDTIDLSQSVADGLDPDSFITGGTGADALIGSNGADRINSGQGGNESEDGDADSITCGGGEDTVFGDSADTFATDCEHATRGISPLVQVADGRANEGDGVSFSIQFNKPTSERVTLDYAVTNQTTSNDDFSPAGQPSGQVTFAPGETGKTVTIPTRDDPDREDLEETFRLTLSNISPPDSVRFSSSTATGTIVDNDRRPIASVTDTNTTEGAMLVFGVALSEPAPGPVEVPFTTSVGTAGTDDFQQVSGTVAFSAGTNSANVFVPTTDDAIDEADETLIVTLSSSSTAIASQTAGSATGTIRDNDPPPVFSIEGGSATEGGGPVRFTVRRTGATEKQTSVRVATSDGTATAPSDYAATADAIDFAPGQNSRSFEVPTVDDGRDEPDETFTAALSNPTNATIDATAGSAIGTIEDDDSAPIFSIEGGSATEGDPVRFTITRTGESDRATSVDYSTSDATAGAPADYTARSDTVTFAAGETSKTFEVPTVEDQRDDDDLTFTATLANPVNATIAPTAGRATGTIEDDDPTPVFSIEGRSATEGNPVRFTITRTGESDRATSVSFSTSDGTAREPRDYEAIARTVNFGPGDMSKSFEVPTVEDQRDDDDLTFTATLANPVNATIAPTAGRATGTIEDDDPTPVFSIEGRSATEGNPVRFTITRTGATDRNTSVRIATSDDTATAPSDYSATTDTISFAPGETSKSVDVTTADDALDELTETFKATLSNANNATIDPTSDSATGTIDDNDPPPVFSIADATATEGNPVRFTITRTGATDRLTSVDFATSDGTAGASGDYAAGSETLSFGPGDTSKNIDVQTAGDALDEPDETFIGTLSDPVNATIDGNAGSATGTIEDDDEPPTTPPTEDDDEPPTTPPTPDPDPSVDESCPVASSPAGTSSADRLIGTAGPDTLLGLGGDDCILGLAGDDRLSGGSGDDALEGGPGKDRVGGGSGDDRLDGRAGGDRLSAGAGSNRVTGGPGDDRINARNDERDRISCGPGRDRVTADRQDEVARGCESVSRR